MGKPFVSVLIDTYNHERFIEEAIVSVLEQDFPVSDREIIVVDDGSTDRTPEIIRKFEPQVRLLRKENGGQASAFNAGIPECKGEIIAFLDGDDWWAREKLRTILPFFDSCPDIGAVGHGCLMVDSSGNLQSTVIPDKTYRLSLKSPSEARLFSSLRSFFGTSKVAYRRALLQRVLPIPEGAIIEADEFLFTTVPCLADVIALNEPLFYYRLHSDNHFMAVVPNREGQQRKFASLSCLLQNLPGKMTALGTPREIVDAVLAPLAIEVEIMRLHLGGGSRWDVLRTERLSYHMEYKATPMGYRIFKQCSLVLALLLPPKQFFRLKSWYSTSPLRDLRRHIGEPVTTAPVIGEMPRRRTE